MPSFDKFRRCGQTVVNLYYDGDEYWYRDGHSLGVCLHCTKLTRWRSIGFYGIPICSTECADAEWQQYSEAEKRAAVRGGKTDSSLQDEGETTSVG